RPARQDDGACRGDHLRVVRNRVGKAEGARGARDPGRHDADRDRSARGRAHDLTHGDLVEGTRGTSCTTTARDDARAVAWWVLLGAGSGAIAGALVGGVGGRLAMLLLRLTSPDHVVGMTSDDGFEIGVVSADTLQLVLAMALLGGINGIVYATLRSAIPRRLRLVLWTVFAAALGGLGSFTRTGSASRSSNQPHLRSCCSSFCPGPPPRSSSCSSSVGAGPRRGRTAGCRR